MCPMPQRVKLQGCSAAHRSQDNTRAMAPFLNRGGEFLPPDPLLPLNPLIFNGFSQPPPPTLAAPESATSTHSQEPPLPQLGGLQNCGISGLLFWSAISTHSCHFIHGSLIVSLAHSDSLLPLHPQLRGLGFQNFLTLRPLQCATLALCCYPMVPPS